VKYNYIDELLVTIVTEEQNDKYRLSEEELLVGANYDGHDFTRDKDPANRSLKYGVSLF
jgi:hypothetical protein